jgi:ubiquinone/menaquinone biosynthesis C-methylase UbiE
MGLLTWLFGRSRRQDKIREDNISSLTSQTVSGAQFETISGRQVLSNATYVLPKGSEEINRLDFQHFMLRTVMQGNYIAPLDKHPRAVLDVGTGTGRWAQEIAYEFPDAYVIGCDLVEQKSDLSSPPPNFQFVEADALKGLPFPEANFDFVHQRLLFLAIPAANWQLEINELARVTRPGGWIELVETELSGQNLGPACRQIGEWMIAISRLRGADPAQMPNIAEHLRAAGLQKIVTKPFTIPVGSWGGRLGTMMATDMVAVTKAMKPLILARLNIDQGEFEKTVQKQQEEWEQFHVVATFHAVCGQKPLV